MPKVPIDLDNADEPPRPNLAFSEEQFSQLIEAVKGTGSDSVEVQAQAHARAVKTALRPENETHPDISAYNPRGERDHPRPLLKCEMFIGPYPMERQTLTVSEIELLNRIEPGSYEITKSDGSTVAFLVIPRLRRDGRTLESLTLAFPCADNDQRHNFPPLVQMLKEVIEQAEVSRLTAAR